MDWVEFRWNAFELLLDALVLVACTALVYICFLIGAAVVAAEDTPEPTCPTVERVVEAAKQYDSHVRVAEVSKAEDVMALAHAYANATGALPQADLALVLMFSRGGAALLLGTRANGLCWLHPDQPPYEAVYQFFMSGT